jgi:aminoglycoside 2''-phosphotransferase
METMDVPQSYLDRIKEYLPGLPIAGVQLNRDGLMNDIVILNEAIVVRFAKDDRATAALAHERAILDLVGQYVELPTPRVNQAHDSVIIYDLIPGEPLIRDELLRLDEASQDRLAEQLALFLRRLHGIPRDALARHGIGASAATRSEQDWARMLSDLEGDLFPHLMAHQRAWIRRQFAPVLEGEVSLYYEPVLIHGDLAAYHILHDPARGILTGVIDFGVAGLGDPAVDFACLIQFLGESFLRRMMRFDPTIGDVLDRARFRAVAVELEWALNGVQTNDAWWWTAHIGNARDALPMGTREQG